jgi:RimJ/RimL family protein N-acetyltransferase
VRLEPLAPAHSEELRAACAPTRTLWRDLYIRPMRASISTSSWDRIDGTAAGKTLAYAVLGDGVCRGMSTYLDIDLRHRTLEIGATYYEPGSRGGPVNPSAKRLLLAHAFDSGAERVQFRVDAINARSRAAVLKLGAVQEGILRNDKLTWTGRQRSTVHFSILKDEWPAVRDRLDARIAALS